MFWILRPTLQFFYRTGKWMEMKCFSTQHIIARIAVCALVYATVTSKVFIIAKWSENKESEWTKMARVSCCMPLHTYDRSTVHQSDQRWLIYIHLPALSSFHESCDSSQTITMQQVPWHSTVVSCRFMWHHMQYHAVIYIYLYIYGGYFSGGGPYQPFYSIKLSCDLASQKREFGCSCDPSAFSTVYSSGTFAGTVLSVRIN